jgi:prepilin-type processing-associated H-X9-DG protein
MKRFCLNRHNEAINVAMLDWSVRHVRLKRLWQMKWNREYDELGPWTRAGGVMPEDWPEWMRYLPD